MIKSNALWSNSTSTWVWCTNQCKKKRYIKKGFSKVCFIEQVSGLAQRGSLKLKYKMYVKVKLKCTSKNYSL